MSRLIVLLILLSTLVLCYKVREDKTKCPRVKALRNFDLHELMGIWYVVEYYASSEEMPEYNCMRARFTVTPENLDISMKFNYSFIDDPEKEKLSGNITWQIPDLHQPAHWIHAEDTYEGIYNTYVIDSDYHNFGLLLHCAEKSGSTRYLSSLVLSRQPILRPNIINYLKEKLPRWQKCLLESVKESIDTSFVEIGKIYRLDPDNKFICIRYPKMPKSVRTRSY